MSKGTVFIVGKDKISGEPRRIQVTSRREVLPLLDFIDLLHIEIPKPSYPNGIAKIVPDKRRPLEKFIDGLLNHI